MALDAAQLALFPIDAPPHPPGYSIDFDGIALAAAAWLGLPEPTSMRIGSQGFAVRSSRDPLPVKVRVAAVRKRKIGLAVCHQVVLSYVALGPDGAPYAWSGDLSAGERAGGQMHVVYYGGRGPLSVSDEKLAEIAAATKALKKLRRA